MTTVNINSELTNNEGGTVDRKPRKTRSNVPHKIIRSDADSIVIPNSEVDAQSSKATFLESDLGELEVEDFTDEEINRLLIAFEAVDLAAEGLIATMDEQHILFQTAIDEVRSTRLMMEKSNKDARTLLSK